MTDNANSSPASMSGPHAPEPGNSLLDCAGCGHPAVVHGGIARPGTDECAYRACDCTEYEEPR